MSDKADPNDSGVWSDLPDRIYAVGDVHGRYDLFRRLINIIEQDAATRDRVIVVYGHLISEDGPVVRANRIGIDTGAYRAERLTAIGIEADDSWLLQTRDTRVLDLTIDDAEPAHVGWHRSSHGEAVLHDDWAAG